MSITLTPDQTAWLSAQVAEGNFPSIDDAARTIIDERIVFESEDLDWVKPLLDEARAGLKRGETVSSEEIDGLLAGFSGPGDSN